MLIGYIGTAILVLSYAVLLKTDKFFWTMNAIASVLLTVHAFQINDISFIFVNGFITVMCTWKSIILTKKNITKVNRGDK